MTVTGLLDASIHSALASPSTATNASGTPISIARRFAAKSSPISNRENHTHAAAPAATPTAAASSALTSCDPLASARRLGSKNHRYMIRRYRCTAADCSCVTRPAERARSNSRLFIRTTVHSDMPAPVTIASRQKRAAMSPPVRRPADPTPP